MERPLGKLGGSSVGSDAPAHTGWVCVPFLARAPTELDWLLSLFGSVVSLSAPRAQYCLFTLSFWRAGNGNSCRNTCLLDPEFRNSSTIEGGGSSLLHALGERPGRGKQHGVHPPAATKGGVHHVSWMYCLPCDPSQGETVTELIGE